ncbi:MAG: hypothetical protein QNJ12_09695 [Ilumatobacter sp.]|uniref:cupredoxin domain-containing protein n=1 Tax=Ilumatobacter sp. TaxID=1967498 RepID=UPI00260FB5EB|nr:hypothetical protein [Ilumatobacter sp.]MDJ0769057.1 hypothetical protein [Ilumatobacter sp.]
MSRVQFTALLLIVPLIVVGAVLLGTSLRDDDAPTGLQITSAADEASYEHDYVIPLGTADRMANGEPVQIVPAELTVRVGDAIRIVNDDSEDHVVGVFFVASGETLTQRFNSAGVLEGECSVHESGSFTLRVEA